MKAFTRVFKYVWPQWPRLIVVFVSAMLIGMLFSLSFATVVPLLKVMMGEEGLRGWVDRNVCNWRYGMNFDVPETPDFLERPDSNLAFYLDVDHVSKGSLAQRAGLKVNDKIVGAGGTLVGEGRTRVTRAQLLQILATTANGSIPVQVRRDNTVGAPKITELTLSTPPKPFYVDWAQGLVGLIAKRGDGKGSKERAVMFIILGMVVVTVMRCIATFYQRYLGEKVVQIVICGLREDVFYHVTRMPLGFFSQEGTSDTVSRIVNDTGQVSQSVKILLGKALLEPMKAAGTLGLAMCLNWKLTLIFLAAGPAAIGFGATLGRKIKKGTRKSLLSRSAMLGRLSDVVGALSVVKVYNRQEHEHTAFTNVNRQLLRRLLHISKVDAATGPVMEVLGMFAGSAALLVGVHWVANANMRSSSFFGLLIALGVTAECVRKSSDIWNRVQMSNAAAERVFGVIDEDLEEEVAGAEAIGPLRREIEFRNVVFSYPRTNKPVLKGINLIVPAGHNVAIVGPNGSGKTTLANLVPRFYNPDSGQILIDGKDIRNATLFSLRNQIGMVTQQIVTFNDTIATNIAYGKPGASREEIIASAKRAFAHEFITPLPKGYDTIIGEQGAGLSGGQLQRIVIARAILRDPAILIFDEATSQVDADSEAKIHNAIEEIMRDRTSFIIAHRFSTVITADVIVVMDRGRIVAQGQHEQLIETCSLYQSLYETQLVRT
ncbi:MAG: ABC transporter transmembrane domain-containing protein [Sedimentisphaerales bacterium]